MKISKGFYYTRHTALELSTTTPLRFVAVSALLWYPKLFARCSLRTISTTAPTHTPFIRHRRRSCSLPSSLERSGFAKHIIASQTLNYSIFIIQSSLFIKQKLRDTFTVPRSFHLIIDKIYNIYAKPYLLFATCYLLFATCYLLLNNRSEVGASP